MSHHHVITVSIFVFVAFFLILPGNDVVDVASKASESRTRRCDLFSGKWVFDNITDRLYDGKKCSFNEVKFVCLNDTHLKWRWQPHECDLPRFDGAAFLEKVRGKKVVLVGDSLSRNQWRSLLCMIEPFLPPGTNKTLILEGNFIFFHSSEYNATIGFHWAPVLVESNNDDLGDHQTFPGIFRVKSIEKHGRQWLDSDVLIFDSYAWWTTHSFLVSWGSSDGPHSTHEQINNTLRVFEMALNSWSDWMEMHFNGTKTKVFFMSPSPFSKLNKTYNVYGTDAGCGEMREPIPDEDYWPSGVDKGMMRMVESVIDKLGERGVKVEYLNVTRLSGYREDAHSSNKVIGWVNWKGSKRYSDCLHWCLPGVPDVWNRILYHYIMRL
ncbi:hypothetical protein M569_00538 [Genlisea aurea]|uniref:Uncharacterized protein n=1 Tax=Genlisea aurea TaxID=192259 RepID=S8D3B6_9LAMI|nr:hypothetical protein M569_00538 [Genlisea aurea]